MLRHYYDACFSSEHIAEAGSLLSVEQLAGAMARYYCNYASLALCDPCGQIALLSYCNINLVSRFIENRYSILDRCLTKASRAYVLELYETASPAN